MCTAEISAISQICIAILK